MFEALIGLFSKAAMLEHSAQLKMCGRQIRYKRQCRAQSVLRVVEPAEITQCHTKSDPTIRSLRINFGCLTKAICCWRKLTALAMHHTEHVKRLRMCGFKRKRALAVCFGLRKASGRIVLKCGGDQRSRCRLGGGTVGKGERHGLDSKKRLPHGTYTRR